MNTTGMMQYAKLLFREDERLISWNTENKTKMV